MTYLDKHQLRPLLRRALSGDASAWNDFFYEIRKYLHAELNRLAGSDPQDRQAHSDIVQSTLRRAWQRIEDQFPDGPEDVALCRFLCWIKTIVSNRRVDELRGLAVNLVHAVGDNIEDIPDGQRADHALKRTQAAAELACALSRLSDKQREVVEMFWFEGLSDAEISKRLDCSQGAVRVVRFRALKQLQSSALRAHLESSHVH
jgi:RNA polymerase sigma factor (sigma-70 family)